MWRIKLTKFISLFGLVSSLLALTVHAEPEIEVVSVTAQPIVHEVIHEYEEPVVYTPLTKTDEIAERIAECHAEMDEIESIGDAMEWYIAYKDIIAKYSDVLDPPESIYDVFTEDDIYIMCRVIETETFQAGFDAKVNVANVILNRINSGKFGDTVYEVCTKPGQFAYGRKNITDDTILALEYAYQIVDTTNGAVYFHSNKTAKKSWNGADYVMTDHVGHHFYAVTGEDGGVE